MGQISSYASAIQMHTGLAPDVTMYYNDVPEYRKNLSRDEKNKIGARYSAV